MAARRGELIALVALAACLAAGRAPAWEAPAVWAAARPLLVAPGGGAPRPARPERGPGRSGAAGLVLVAPGWCALRTAGLERDLGRSGAAPVAAALSLAVWTPPLAAAYLLGLTLTAVIAAVLLVTALLLVTVREPSALPRA